MEPSADTRAAGAVMTRGRVGLLRAQGRFGGRSSTDDGEAEASRALIPRPRGL